MRPLDVRTVERLTDVICDLGGPYERRGGDLQRLLEAAGWPEAVEYDGSPRVPWLRENLLSRREDTALMERVICRVCDALEFDEGEAAARLARKVVNQVLESEGLMVTVVGGRPVLGEIVEGGDGLSMSLPDDLEERLSNIIADPQAVKLLTERAAEAEACVRGSAHTLALIGLGSFLEGVLYAVLREHAPDMTDKFVDADGRRVPWERANLAHMINVAHSRKWIQVDAKEFIHKVRDYRNLVHPRLQFDLGLVPDDDTVMMCVGPVRAVLNDLAASLPERI